MLFGRPLKHIRHVDEVNITLEPQRFFVHTFWRFSTGAAARSDGDDIENNTSYPEGSIITKHKMEILITPETIEPQQIYMGRIKLSFNDIYSWAMCGSRFEHASYQTTPTGNNVTTAITPHLFPNVASDKLLVGGADTANQEIGDSGSGKTITDWKLDDHIHHFINLKKITVFDQRPLMGERFQRIPSKVKRINEGTAYMLFFFNDSPRGGTPADTQVKINIKSEINELAI